MSHDNIKRAMAEILTIYCMPAAVDLKPEILKHGNAEGFRWYPFRSTNSMRSYQILAVEVWTELPGMPSADGAYYILCKGPWTQHGMEPLYKMLLQSFTGYPFLRLVSTEPMLPDWTPEKLVGLEHEPKGDVEPVYNDYEITSIELRDNGSGMIEFGLRLKKGPEAIEINSCGVVEVPDEKPKVVIPDEPKINSVPDGLVVPEEDKNPEKPRKRTRTKSTGTRKRRTKKTESTPAE